MRTKSCRAGACGAEQKVPTEIRKENAAKRGDRSRASLSYSYFCLFLPRRCKMHEMHDWSAPVNYHRQRFAYSDAGKGAISIPVEGRKQKKRNRRARERERSKEGYFWRNVIRKFKLDVVNTAREKEILSCSLEIPIPDTDFQPI